MDIGFMGVRVLRKIVHSIDLPAFAKRIIYKKIHSGIERKIIYDLSLMPFLDGQDSIRAVKPNGMGSETVWMFWWDPNNITELSESNIRIARNIFDENFVLVTASNIAEYLELPDWLLEKLSNDEITIQLFSDIVRMALLSNYGGVWADSTIMFVPNKNMKLMFNLPFYSRKGSDVFCNEYVPAGRWSIYLFGGKSELPLFAFVLSGLLRYVKYGVKPPDYFLVDYLVDMGFKQDVGHICDYWSYVPVNNEDIETLKPIQDDLVNLKLVNEILANTFAFKMSNKDVPNFTKDQSMFKYIKKLGSNTL